MKTLFEKGLNNKMFVAQPYEVLYGEFISAKDFNQFDRTNTQNSFAGTTINLLEHEELRWNDQPGPTYNWEQAAQILKDRYSNVSAQFHLALEILGKTISFKKIIEQLREEGWLDWQIMSAITHVAANYQFNLKARNMADRRDVQKIWFDILGGKVQWSMIPAKEFSKDNLLYALRVSMLSTCKLLGLECRQIKPDLEAIDDFLRYRYNYWTDDVPHEELTV
jgi:hypothetical protein